MEATEVLPAGKHVFLTGNIQIGKSTAINRALALSGITPGGFRTVAGPKKRDGSDSIHLIRADGSEAVSDENMVFTRCRSAAGPQFSLFPAVFNIHGCALLTPGQDMRLILMDEIGIREADCLPFHRGILSALSGNTPVLGVVQNRPGGFLQEIRTHPKVSLITVTADNRDTLPALLCHWILDATAR